MWLFNLLRAKNNLRFFQENFDWQKKPSMSLNTHPCVCTMMTHLSNFSPYNMSEQDKSVDEREMNNETIMINLSIN